MATPIKQATDGREATLDLNSPEFYLNRELSTLAFFERVLEEARDKENPLLERVKFLAILGSNLDEFFMIRVGGLKLQLATGVSDLSIDGLTPAEQLADIRSLTLKLLEEGHHCFDDMVMPALKKSGIFLLNFEELNSKQRGFAKQYFDEVIFPVLTPQGYDPGHPFPHISNLSLNLAVMIRDEGGTEHFARVKVPATLPRLVPLKRSSGGVRRDGTVARNHYFVWIEQLIIAYLDSLFPGMEILEANPFRIIRNADTVLQELEADDLLESMELNVRQRRFGEVVRLSITPSMSASTREFLVETLEIDPNDAQVLDEPLGLGSLWALHGIDRYDLKDPSFHPAIPRTLASDAENSTIFRSIRSGDILLHHPYDSYSPVIDFIKEASRDPKVLAIKQCLYRVSQNSPIVNSLLKARRDHGKQVTALVELKARFDEESNISWARLLEREGVHVVYGLLGLKTHSKVALVVREEGENIRRYIHLGTGNYNHITAQSYEDFSFFTCDPDIGADATDLFNYLTGYSNKKDYRKLLVAPINLRDRIEELIRQEIEHKKSGGSGQLIFKMNSLVDKPIIRLLYDASCAGVKIDLIVRGICCLKPGIQGVSENIRIISVVGRFLEHSRIYYFQNGGDEKVYMGSADLMPRNLNRRVEVLFPIEEKGLIRNVRDVILETYLKDNRRARLMQPDGSYVRLQPGSKEKAVDSQNDLILAREA
ncbi:MAG TPA: polyphosphate kinase 1 [Anaerolineales bacterium]|nr:polyphosphate kinase 1 [Anaerolineales bacterium]